MINELLEDLRDVFWGAGGAIACLMALVVAVIVLVACLAVRDARAWEIRRVEHDCSLTGHTRTSLLYMQQVGQVLIPIYGNEYEYHCDDGNVWRIK